jgi:hypothetical protein
MLEAGSVSSEGREFARRSRRRHPVLSALYAAVGVGLAVVGILNLALGHVDWRRWLYPALWIAWFVLLVVLIRRDEPPTEQQ